MNHFEFYGLPLSFVLDTADLRKRYYQISRETHPDFHTQASAAQQAEMLDRSAYNNVAYNTLNDPDARMRYVLTIKGLIGDEQNLPVLPQDFLMEMMEINEALMELEFDPAGYSKLLAQLESVENAINQTVAEDIAHWTDSPNQEARLMRIREFYLKKRYLLRIRENLSKFASP